MNDLLWAIAHHLLAFGIFGLLFAEFVALRGALNETQIRRIAALDLAYGVLALLLVVIGFLRANLAAKGWHYYAHNAFFWAKIATFALVGLLSVPPTIAYIRWRRADGPPGDAQVRQVRRLLWAEVILFALLPAFAAAMARGYGEFS